MMFPMLTRLRPEPYCTREFSIFLSDGECREP